MACVVQFGGDTRRNCPSRFKVCVNIYITGPIITLPVKILRRFAQLLWILTARRHSERINVARRGTQSDDKIDLRQVVVLSLDGCTRHGHCRPRHADRCHSRRARLPEYPVLIDKFVEDAFELTRLRGRHQQQPVAPASPTHPAHSPRTAASSPTSSPNAISTIRMTRADLLHRALKWLASPTRIRHEQYDVVAMLEVNPRASNGANPGRRPRHVPPASVACSLWRGKTLAARS